MGCPSCPPLDWTSDDILHLYIDASGSVGYGLVLGNSYAYGVWPDELKKNHITLLELFPIFFAFKLFPDHLKNQKVRIHTDNIALVSILNNQTSKKTTYGNRSRFSPHPPGNQYSNLSRVYQYKEKFTCWCLISSTGRPLPESGTRGRPRASPHSRPPSTGELQARLQCLLGATLSDASTKTFYRAWDAICKFLVARGCKTTTPVSTEALALFISHLDIAGYAPSTISTYISAIAYVHKMSGVSDPANSFIIRKLLEALPKTSSVSQTCLPITLDLLHKLISSISCLFQGYDRALYAAVFSLAFHLCARVGELTVSNGNLCNVLCCDHLTISRSDSRILKLTVIFEHYKHKRQKMSGSRMVLPTGDAFCPLEYLSAYLQICPQIPGILFLRSSGHPLHSTDVTRALHRCIHHLRLDIKCFSTHGFRIGGTTEGAVHGASDAQLRMLGRWKSNAFLSYIRPQAFTFTYWACYPQASILSLLVGPPGLAALENTSCVAPAWTPQK